MTGRRLSQAVRHMESRMKMADGMMEKNSCSKVAVKSKSSRQPRTLGPKLLSLLDVEKDMMSTDMCNGSQWRLCLAI